MANLVISLIHPATASCSGPQEFLLVGRAHFMAGNLSDAIPPLQAAAASGDPAGADAHYLLGRIHLLMGDYRQSKEYFERAFEDCSGANPQAYGCWRAAMGIGDALYGNGNYQEAIRRYREAGQGSGVNRPELDLRIALADMAQGRREESLERLREALSRIPVLSGWRGREEDFIRTLTMQGLNRNAPDIVRRFYVLVGPVGREVTTLDGIEIDSSVLIQRVRIEGRFFLEVGPFWDSIEAVMMAESIKSGASLSAEIISR